VCDGLDGEVFWLVAQRGRCADWVRNIQANPRVRVKVRSGAAAVVPGGGGVRSDAVQAQQTKDAGR
jgi:hypothetical protein